MVQLAYKLDDDCARVFKEFHQGHKHRAIVFTTNSEDKIVVEETITKKKDGNAQFEELVATILKKWKKSVRMIVLELPGKSRDGRDVEKIFYINWVPDGAKIKAKMIQASVKAVLFKSLNMTSKINFQIQASDAGDLELRDLLDKIAQKN